jgi:diadenosine tetraphosphate (Ap4A) HIT family hydrolase
MLKEPDCELCAQTGGELLWKDELCRVVRVVDASGEAFPGSCRVILNRHVAEMSDLGHTDVQGIMSAVLATERALRKALRPDKINLASLGNLVPHLHWHVVPRWHDDSHFPAPIWAAAQRPAAPHDIGSAADLRSAIVAELSTVTNTP